MYFIIFMEKNGLLKINIYILKNQKINLKKLSLLRRSSVSKFGCAIMICNKINKLKIETNAYILFY